MRDLVHEAGEGTEASRTWPVCCVVVQRQLEGETAGNDTYLALVLRAIREAGFRIEIVLAPERSFGNRPWSSLAPGVRALADAVVWPGTRRVGSRIVSLAPRVWLRFLRRLGQEALRRAGARAAVRSRLGDPLPPREARAVLDRIAARRPALVVAEYSSLAPLLAGVGGGAVRAVLLHDLFSSRAATMRAAGREPDFAPLDAAEEAARCGAADLLLYASENERRSLAPRLPGRTHCWVRPLVPCPALAPEAAGAGAAGAETGGAETGGAETGRTGKEGRARAVFLGTRHAGNEDALAFLAEEVWPRVLGLVPGAELWVVGSIGETAAARRLALPGLRRLGRVPRLAEIGGPASVGLAPTRVASGVSIKVAEYLALGMPAVAMPAALEGFGGTLDDLVVRVATAEEAARETAALLRDPARRARLSEAGRAGVAARLGNGEFAAILRDVATGAERHAAHPDPRA